MPDRKKRTTPSASVVTTLAQLGTIGAAAIYTEATIGGADIKPNSIAPSHLGFALGSTFAFSTQEIGMAKSYRTILRKQFTASDQGSMVGQALVQIGNKTGSKRV